MALSLAFENTQKYVWCFSAGIFNHWEATHWCATNDLCVCYERLGESDLIVNKDSIK